VGCGVGDFVFAGVLFLDIMVFVVSGFVLCFCFSFVRLYTVSV